MSRRLGGLRIGYLERPHPAGHRGVTEGLLPLLRDRGARVEVVHAERGFHRLDVAPAWDLVVLKSGSAAALHLAATAEAWGVPALNSSRATQLAQDKLASAAILQRAGLPIAPSYLAWVGSGEALEVASLAALADRALIVKAGRGSQGVGLWSVDPGDLAALASHLPAGPYLLMERIAHRGDDLKVFAAGAWLSAIERPFPASTYEAKLGRAVSVPRGVEEVVHEVGRLLELTCFGCDFVSGPRGWSLVDVNAFPGYKGAEGAPRALAAEVVRVAAARCAR